MDLKSIVFKKRMKFLFNIIPISNFLSLNWACPCDVPGIPEPSRRLSYMYSRHHSPQPKSDGPNTAWPTKEILVAKVGTNDPSTSLPKYLYSMREGIQRECGHGPYLLPLLEYERSPNHIFVPTNRDIDVEDLLLEPDNDILSPKQYDNLNYLLNVDYYDTPSFNKTKIFIETKVTAMKLQGFNL